MSIPNADKKLKSDILVTLSFSCRRNAYEALFVDSVCVRAFGGLYF